MATHSVYAAGAAIVLSASRIAVMSLIARRLRHDAFGQFAYAQWLVDIAFLACSFGATGAVSRYLAEYKTAPGQISTFLHRWAVVALTVPCLAAIAAIAGARLSGLSLGVQGEAMLAVWVFAQGLWTMQAAALTGCQRFDLILLSNAVFAAAALGGMFVLPINADRPLIVFAVMAAGAICASLVGASHLRRLMHVSAGTLDAGKWRSIRAYGLNMWLTGLLWSLVWSRGEYPVVRRMLGDEGLAAYAVAMAVFAGAIQGVMLGVSAAAPYLTRLIGEGKRDAAATAARRLMDLQLLGCGIAAVSLTLLGQELLAVAFGSRFNGANEALSVLSIALVSLALSAQNHLLQIDTNGRYNRDAALVAVAGLFILAVSFIPAWHLVGAAAARTVTMLGLAIASVIFTVRRWGWLAVSLKNFVTVNAVVLVAVAASSLGLRIRLAILICACCLLSAIIRSADREIVLLIVLRRLFPVRSLTLAGSRAN
jgi:O-antigen/teichoic acid export membrane protein